jgi:dihydroorotase
MGFFAPHLKHILKNNLCCCAICFFAASVIGIYTVLIQRKALFYLSVLTLFISQKCTRRLVYSQSYANSRVVMAIPVYGPPYLTVLALLFGRP